MNGWLKNFLTIPGALIFASFTALLIASMFAPPGNPVAGYVVKGLVWLFGTAGIFTRTVFTGDEAQQKASLHPPGGSLPPVTMPQNTRLPLDKGDP